MIADRRPWTDREPGQEGQDATTAKIAAERLGQRIRLFGDTVVRRRSGDSQVYLMNRQRRGWGEYAIPYRAVADIEVFYSVEVGEWGNDEHGDVAAVLRKPETKL